MRSNTVYIAGPMRGYANNNAEAFNRAEARLLRRGFKVFNPVSIGRGIASDKDIEDDPELLRSVMRIERSLIRHCEAIYLLEGWKNSKGAKSELVSAISFDCKVLLESKDVEARLDKEYKNGKKPWDPDDAEVHS